MVKTEREFPSRVCLRIAFRDIIEVKVVPFQPMIDEGAKWKNVFTILTI